ncbi:sulfoxide reductase heme-binding subunit YedZ [Nisaea acidiphila]|uniref:Protein-methionine-sulfoxide reductase heme-binding subunit MsrQ n=1 Tax=Nisaea acidiphila TaxID=1862145 RepID=A0A9J7AM81_9PROT|nr:protein-methionine-sulfoxide reductase heme-binding subunit MsrQ [Nisaea acidiphila]UUX48576.1 sulfoxide reductase heme-binding subunit YedZ [Nisaea acidiphila]
MSIATLRRPSFGMLPRHLPWTDRSGRLSRLKLAVFLALLAPAIFLLADALAGTLGARPWDAAIHRAGWWTTLFLLASLAVTPLRRALRWGELMTVRRMVGVTVFFGAALHLVLYAGQEAWDLPKVASEIALRFYLTTGFVALLGLGALAATSTDGMVRRLGGRRWQRLHKLVYPVALLALVHFFLQSKSDVTEPLLFSGLFAWLMGYRIWHWRTGDPGGVGLAMLAAVAALLTSAAEIVFLSLKYPVSPWDMALAQLDFDAGIRPAWWVLLAGLSVAIASELRQRQKHTRA